jgi:hypothetical protein
MQQGVLSSLSLEVPAARPFHVDGRVSWAAAWVPDIYVHA